MFNLENTFLEMPPVDVRPRTSHGLRLRVVGHDAKHRQIMTHVPKGKVWSGPGITGSVRRRMMRDA